MECKKCKVSVPSEYEYALAKNVCPKCGSKLLVDKAMKMYLDLKTKLASIEFVMDKSAVCERVAMFMITNYEVSPLTKEVEAVEQSQEIVVTEKKQTDIEKFKQQLATIEEDTDLTDDEIRAQEAFRAEEIAAAREMGVDVDDDMPELPIKNKVDVNRVERLKKLALSGNTGVRVNRADRD